MKLSLKGKIKMYESGLSKTARILLIILACLLGYLFIVSGCSMANAAQEIQIENKAGENHVFFLSVADTPEKSRIGLSGRTYLPEDAGMLFLSQEPRDIQLWMLNTLIPLDMFFFDDNLRIVHIHQNAIPNDLTIISSGQKVRGVIELNGGISIKKNIQVGDKIYFK